MYTMIPKRKFSQDNNRPYLPKYQWGTNLMQNQWGPNFDLNKQAGASMGLSAAGDVIGALDNVDGESSMGGSIAGGAAKGAAAGMVLGPWGAAAGAVIGGIGGAIKQKAQERAIDKAKREAEEADRRIRADASLSIVKNFPTQGIDRPMMSGGGLAPIVPLPGTLSPAMAPPMKIDRNPVLAPAPEMLYEAAWANTRRPVAKAYTDAIMRDNNYTSPEQVLQHLNRKSVGSKVPHQYIYQDGKYVQELMDRRIEKQESGPLTMRALGGTVDSEVLKEYGLGRKIQGQEASYLAEGGETIQYAPGQAPATDGSGSLVPLSSTTSRITGASHSAPSQGVGMTGGERIFSDRLKVNKDFSKLLKRL